jgi:hypothetical protein
MAGVKITDLELLTTPVASDDLLYIVDVSDTSESPQGTSKAIEVGNIGRTYKVYTALLTQSGETAPTAIELENTLGAITFGYNNDGRYSILCSNLFTYEKTAIFVSPLNNANTEAVSVINEAGSSEYFLDTLILSSGAFANGFLQNTAIEIRVYN